MFDGLRSDANETPGFDEPVEYFPDEKPAPAEAPAPRPKPKRRPTGKILGLNAQQRFIVSLLLMFAVCALGSMCLLITGKFVIP